MPVTGTPGSNAEQRRTLAKIREDTRLFREWNDARKAKGLQSGTKSQMRAEKAKKTRDERAEAEVEQKSTSKKERDARILAPKTNTSGPTKKGLPSARGKVSKGPKVVYVQRKLDPTMPSPFAFMSEAAKNSGANASSKRQASVVKSAQRVEKGKDGKAASKGPVSRAKETPSVLDIGIQALSNPAPIILCSGKAQTYLSGSPFKHSISPEQAAASTDNKSCSTKAASVSTATCEAPKSPISIPRANPLKRKSEDRQDGPSKRSSSVESTKIGQAAVVAPTTVGKQDTAGVQGFAAPKLLKRRSEDDLGNDNKRQKVGTFVKPAPLINHSSACFINAGMQLLHAIPQIQKLGDNGAGDLKAHQILNEEQLHKAKFCGETRQAKIVGKLLESGMAQQSPMSLLPYFQHQMRHISGADDSSDGGLTHIFHRVCGETLDSCGEKMNGETQQDAHELITKVLERLDQEDDCLHLRDSLEAKFVARQTCICNKTKSFEEVDPSINIPESIQARNDPVPFKACVEAFLKGDSGKFDEYVCEDCGSAKLWSTSEKEGWTGSRMVNAPAYMLLHLNRMRYTQYGGFEKIETKIVPPTRAIGFPALDGNTVKYNMVAMIEHHGSSGRGHYTTIRKVGETWWHCDDANRAGTVAYTRANVEKRALSGCLYPLKKVDDEE